MENVDQKYGKVRTLDCSVCGHKVRGRQWSDMDTGYGVCQKCTSWLAEHHGYSARDMSSYYGIHGVHFGLPTPGEIDAQIEEAMQTRRRIGASDPTVVKQTFVNHENFVMGFSFHRGLKAGDIVNNDDGSWFVVLAVVE